MSRETLEFDVVIVGAGPAGLAAACRLGQLARGAGRELAIAVVEKGAAIGAHIMSGAVIEPRALDELFPDWRERGAPLGPPVSVDRFQWLRNSRSAMGVPRALVPRLLRNHGNHVASLGDLCRWLGERAESLGCSLLPGFAATEVLYDGDRVAGVATGDMGVARDGTRKPNFQEGYELRSRYVVFAEGCRGNLGRALERRFALRVAADPQHFGLGLKEIWQVDPAKHRPGEVLHTFGWPLDDATEGGGFVYHAAERRVYLGLIVGLSYANPHLDPFAELQRWKTHPAIRSLLEGGQRIAYGARAVNKGGLQSLPALAVPGGLLVGCEAGFLNGAKIKGSHTAMKTGMLAAEAIFAALAHPPGADADAVAASYTERVRASWVWDELYRARNFSPGIAKLGTLAGGALAFVEQNVLRGHVPFTLHNRVADHARLERASEAAAIDYPKPDGAVSFDRMSSVFLSSTVHDENQPVHLRLADPALPIASNLPLYDEPAQRYCPAGVYEVVRDAAGAAQFRINAANCVHCKTCDIKDPAQNITWVPPEGGSGPSYAGM
ncbi:MAG TPA: electron transfer flavoprotein-ubiquinone oxidoreductase [Gammaproteobacteria bacterium]|nr:electron transfer flavoprotein-ubiquinone oxidoreductase [Gammaproteobacteria bacterium]